MMMGKNMYMAMAIKNPDASAVSTDRFRTWRTSMSGSEILSSRAIQRPIMIRQKATSPRERSDVHPQLPPSLSSTETPTTAAPRVTIPR